jgi:hypothetical protein
MVTIPNNVAFEQAKAELIHGINYYMSAPLNIPAYEMELILRDLYDQVYNRAQQEYNQNLAAYEAAMQAESEANNKDAESEK